MNKWVTCMVNTITTCVYFSNRVWLKLKASEDKPPDKLLPKFIMCAIRSTVTFFSRYGIDPKPPDWFLNVVSPMPKDKVWIGQVVKEYQREKQDGKEYDASSCNLPNDFNTFVTLAFALYLQSGIIKGKYHGRHFDESMEDINALFRTTYTTGTTEGEGDKMRKWTLNIQLYVNMLEEDQDNMIQKTVTNMTIAYLATYEQREYKTTTNSTEIVINKHSDEQ